MQTPNGTTLAAELWSIVFSNLDLNDLVQIELVCKLWKQQTRQFIYLALFFNKFAACALQDNFLYELATYHCQLFGKKHAKNVGHAKYHKLALVNARVHLHHIPVPRNVKEACKIRYLVQSIFERRWNTPQCLLGKPMATLPQVIVKWHACHFLLAVVDATSVLHIGDVTVGQWCATMELPAVKRIVLHSVPQDYKATAKTKRKVHYYRLFGMFATEVVMYKVVDDHDKMEMTIEKAQTWKVKDIIKISSCSNLTFAVDTNNHLFVLRDDGHISSNMAYQHDSNFSLANFVTSEICDMQVVDITRYHPLHKATGYTYLHATVYGVHYEPELCLLQIIIDSKQNVVAVNEHRTHAGGMSPYIYSQVAVSPSALHCHCRLAYRQSRAEGMFTIRIDNESAPTCQEEIWASRATWHENMSCFVEQSDNTIYWFDYDTWKPMIHYANSYSYYPWECCISNAGFPIIINASIAYVGIE